MQMRLGRSLDENLSLIIFVKLRKIKQRANKEKAKTSTIIAKTQPQATTAGLHQQQQLLDISDM